MRRMSSDRRRQGRDGRYNRAMKRLRRPASAAIMASALSALGCATSYYPNSPHIAVVRGQFQRGFVKEGVYYPGGLFGGRVTDAVRGVPEAERHAEAYGTLSTAGSIGIFGSEALGITSSVVSATASRGDAKTDAEIGLVVASGVALVTGIVLHLMAEPHLFDAANIYNDEIDRRARTAGPAGVQHGQHQLEPSQSPPQRIDAQSGR